MTDAARNEHIRQLRQQGLSEADAVRAAHKSSDPVDPEDPSMPELGDDMPDLGNEDRQWVVVTRDFSGLGWAKKLKEEGETVTIATDCPEEKPEDKKAYGLVGAGQYTVMDLSDAVKSLKTDNTYWIFSENICPEIADKLRTNGQKVFGTGALQEKLEHDRQFTLDLVQEYGLEAPESQEFKTVEDGLSFLEQNPDKAYVLKPDDGKANYSTFVPRRKADANANRETYDYLAHMKEDPGTYILQERISGGLEINVEVWIYEGTPCFAFATLESKRKNPNDDGEMCGCAGDFLWKVDVNSKLVQDTIGMLLPYYKEESYTGFADVNVILTPSGPKFLEVCNRFGYNSHISLFLGLATDAFGNILADFIDGHIEDLESRFAAGIAGSVTLFLDHPREGLPVHLDEEIRERFYPFDGYEEEGTFLLAGYSNEVGVLTGQGASIEAVANDCLNVLQREGVSYPDMYFRRDLGQGGYPNAPVDRYRQLKQKGYVS